MEARFGGSSRFLAVTGVTATEQSSWLDRLAARFGMPALARFDFRIHREQTGLSRQPSPRHFVVDMPVRDEGAALHWKDGCLHLCAAYRTIAVSTRDFAQYADLDRTGLPHGDLTGIDRGPYPVVIAGALCDGTRGPAASRRLDAIP